MALAWWRSAEVASAKLTRHNWLLCATSISDWYWYEPNRCIPSWIHSNPGHVSGLAELVFLCHCQIKLQSLLSSANPNLLPQFHPADSAHSAFFFLLHLLCRLKTDTHMCGDTVTQPMQSEHLPRVARCSLCAHRWSSVVFVLFVLVCTIVYVDVSLNLRRRNRQTAPLNVIGALTDRRASVGF